MAIPQILPYDHFHQWRDKTNQIANLLGDLTSVNVAATDRDTFVESINKVISNIGTLASLTTADKDSTVEAVNELNASIGDLTTLDTTVKTSTVGAINEVLSSLGELASLNTTDKGSLVESISEVQTELGDITTLSTTDKTDAVSGINEVFASLLIGDASFSVGPEVGGIIRVTVQLKDRLGSDLAISAGVTAYLSDNSNGMSLAASAPSGGWVIGTNGVLIPIVSGKAATFICNSSGSFNIDITESSAKSFYLVVVLPLGNLKISTAITFA